MVKKKRNRKSHKYPAVVFRKEVQIKEKHTNNSALNWFIVTVAALVITAAFNWGLNYVSGNVQLDFKEPKSRGFILSLIHI